MVRLISPGALSFAELTPLPLPPTVRQSPECNSTTHVSEATPHPWHSRRRTPRRILHAQPGFHRHNRSPPVRRRIQTGFWGRERLRCLVWSAEVKGFIYASFAKGMPPLNGRRCTTQLPSTPAFAPPVMEIGIFNINSDIACFDYAPEN
ncbi:hypothetical protein C1H46_017238 [Malus baccata]|uniref:Uncharacterized protein n=1 Tax=Malus baccata TaxID=106549 RepID=A0A540MFF8_MALBA|nr:hypothetical protein C1H46_017238 [Malus baccata]